MLWKQLFTPVNAVEPEEAKDLIARWPEGSYTLLDVRQPGEYENEHLPGALLVPMAQLADALKTLDPEKPIIVY
jgi:sulfur-carrier protein adenylyltransferase/sulfurtransferase